VQGGSRSQASCGQPPGDIAKERAPDRNSDEPQLDGHQRLQRDKRREQRRLQPKRQTDDTTPSHAQESSAAGQEPYRKKSGPVGPL